MKENEFRAIMSKIDTDSSTDRKITEQLLNYQGISKLDYTIMKRNRQSILFFIKRGKQYFANVSKVAVAIVLLTIVGTATAWAAASYFAKSYTVDIQVKTVEDIKPLLKDFEYSTSKTFGAYKNERTIYTDPSGNVFDSDIDGILRDGYGNALAVKDVYDPVKSGNEVFAVLGLPNLVPTYLLDNYTLDPSGYSYTEQEATEFKCVRALFWHGMKAVDIAYEPIKDSENSNTSTYIIGVGELDTSNYIKSTYITKSGLICNILDLQDELTISAEIHFESNTLGEGSYILSFTKIEMDEIEAILDSIPISSTE